MRGALPDAEQRAHAELAHRLDVENLDADAELAQRRGAARELGRIEDVRRLVDEIAREHDAVARPPAGSLQARRAPATSATASVSRALLGPSSPSLRLVL